MDEMKIKKRGWIKNAVIVFLSVMLILTFFSNTFMNHSLSEVSTKLVISGEITAQVRGGGTVTANENYSVTLPQTRTVESVKVKVGDEVREGDVLFTLSGNMSDELRAAEDKVYELNLAYQKALITAATGEGTQGDREIQRAREDLEIAQADYNSYSNNGQLSKRQAKSEMDSAQAVLDAANAEVKKYEKQLSGLNPGGDGGGGSSAPVNQAKAAWDDAISDFEAKQIVHGSKYKELLTDVVTKRLNAEANGTSYSADLVTLYVNIEYARFIDNSGELTAANNALTNFLTGDSATQDDKKVSDAYKKNSQSKIDVYMKAEVEQLMPDASGDDKNPVKLPDKVNAYNELTKAKEAVASAKRSYDSAYENYWNSLPTGNSAEYNRVKRLLDKAVDDQTAAQTAYNSKEAIYKGIDESTTALNAAITALEKLEQDAKIAALDLDSQRRQIARAQQELAELQQDATEPEIKAKVSGIIGEINVTAGKEAEAGTTLCTITVPDMGYNVSFSATSEQARRVRVGEEAVVANNWRGGITATVASVKTDPKNPQNSKIITFDITGDVEPGTTLNLTVGSRGEQYETIVPNSALRSDANGDFVLVVTSRSSPLGNRYIATRVNVEKKASDDTNTAVTGDLSANDYVITTSSKPIKDKDMVRLAGE